MKLLRVGDLGKEKVAEFENELLTTGYSPIHLASEEDLIKKIADDINFKEYHKMFKNYGQGMAHISRNSCSYCYTQLPPQTLVEIEFDKKIIRCPSCSVFLYHKNETE